MRGRWWEGLPAEHVSGRDAHVLLGHGPQLPPERVERIAVEAAGRALEARGVDQVRSADFGDPHRQLGVPLHDRAGRACVVEVDVGQQEVAQIGELDAVLAETLDQPRERRGRSPVLQRETLVRLDQVHADRFLPAVEVQVDESQRSHNRIF